MSGALWFDFCMYYCMIGNFFPFLKDKAAISCSFAFANCRCRSWKSFTAWSKSADLTQATMIFAFLVLKGSLHWWWFIEWGISWVSSFPYCLQSSCFLQSGFRTLKDISSSWHGVWKWSKVFNVARKLFVSGNVTIIYSFPWFKNNIQILWYEIYWLIVSAYDLQESLN